ncbi:MAG: uridine kinase [Anaerolineales bacterium]|nr:uridine kinase [Anaerolineales bacterium]
MHSTRTPIIIGISGGTGSGKSTVASVILKRTGEENLAFLPHDAYYKNLSSLPHEQRTRINFDHPDSLETELLIEHLQMLKKGQAVEVPTYDFTRHARTEKTVHVEPQPVILVEGILIFADRDLRKLFDVKIFVDTPADIRFIRRLQRDIIERGRTVESVIEQYQKTVRPMHMEFVEPSKRYADVIIPEGGHNTVAMDMVVSRIADLLTSGFNTEE